MKQVAIYREVGQTRPTASASTFLGAFLGSKSAAKSVERTIFNTNQRTLRRKQQVWACSGACARAVAAANASGPTNGSVLLLALVGIVVAIFVFGNDETPSAAVSKTAPVAPSVPTALSETANVPEAPVNYIGRDVSSVPTAPQFPVAPEEQGPSEGTCYLKPGTENVIVTDWEDKMSCAIELGLADR